MVDLGHLYMPSEYFNTLLPCQQEVDAGQLRDAALITSAVEESEQEESGDEAGA